MTLQQIHFLQEIRPDKSFMQLFSYMCYDWSIFCVAMQENDGICSPTFEEQWDESFLHSVTHDWPISHVAMRESDTFHLTGHKKSRKPRSDEVCLNTIHRSHGQ